MIIIMMMLVHTIHTQYTYIRNTFVVFGVRLNANGKFIFLCQEKKKFFFLYK